MIDLGGSIGNDIWGWTDPQDASEYALMGMDNGTVFVRLNDPDNPVIVGRLPTATVNAPWRDIKVAQNHAYIVADNVGNHGMQVFDLTRLRGVSDNRTFLADIVYGDFGSAHNVVINEQTGFAYVVGSDTCNGGLHMIDIKVPGNPRFAGCHASDGDTLNYPGTGGGIAARGSKADDSQQTRLLARTIHEPATTSAQVAALLTEIATGGSSR